MLLTYKEKSLNVVRSRGLEPPRVAPLAPQASASTNSATTAGGGMRVRPAGRRNGADVTVRLWPDKGCSRAVGATGAAFRAVYREEPANQRLLRLGRARQELLDLDRDLVAADDHRSLGDRQVVGEDIDLVFLGRIELDDGAAAESQHLMDRHR